MLIFGNDQHARGCFREIMGEQTQIRTAAYLNMGGSPYPTVGGSGGNGAVADTSGTPDPFFISNVSLGQKEKYNVVQCFGDRNYTYAFGHDPTASMLEVTFTLFITDSGGTQFGDSLKTMTTAYANSRLSKYPYYAFVTVGATSYKGFVVGMSSSTMDQEHNLQSFTVLILVVETQDGV